jgi:hypothetical protein
VNDRKIEEKLENTKKKDEERQIAEKPKKNDRKIEESKIDDSDKKRKNEKDLKQERKAK